MRKTLMLRKAPTSWLLALLQIIAAELQARASVPS